MSVIVYDGDDTAYGLNEPQYSGAYVKGFSFMYETLAWMPNLHALRNRLFSIEGDLFKTWGIKRGRVGEALVLLYREVCQWAEWRFGENMRRDEHEAKLREIGDQPFDHSKIWWLPGAREVLRHLQHDGHQLFLLTSYDEYEFQKRIPLLGIDEFFPPQRRKVITRAKTKEDFIELVGWKDKDADSDDRCYAVGNGESDFLPALEIAENWRGIYIPHGSTSKYFAEGGYATHLPAPICYFMPAACVHPRVHTIRAITELLPLIRSLA